MSSTLKHACLVAAKAQFYEAQRKLERPQELDWDTCAEIAKDNPRLEQTLPQLQADWTRYLEQQKQAFNLFYEELKLLVQFFEKLDSSQVENNPTETPK
ncbi:MAG: hypothetical protein FWC74_02915 [Candidatus Bathyarchaeota archaeon]|nr:hypothetical protein [Candidatus Termitimicrobium sp.]